MDEEPMPLYVKGLEISREVTADLLAETPGEEDERMRAVVAFHQAFSREAYIRLDYSYLPKGENLRPPGDEERDKDIVHIIVLDEDYDLEALRARALPHLHPEIQEIRHLFKDVGVWMSASA